MTSLKGSSSSSDEESKSKTPISELVRSIRWREAEVAVIPLKSNVKIELSIDEVVLTSVALIVESCLVLDLLLLLLLFLILALLIILTLHWAKTV